ncbi:Hypothetical_protein [Hexamita inflata]|uniref:Hypothetical_protein n=1 Tax=Hexamita inflata TaxID=28002 RepID=A0AA86QD48_9EUKA|nr:Hypothetical protein HINF_LOCUS37495 [Hexamita inflata]CAI9949856.1 Hypothetical protein HINF_LOCUS37501 [Hexamita inflata]
MSQIHGKFVQCCIDITKMANCYQSQILLFTQSRFMRQLSVAQNFHICCKICPVMKGDESYTQSEINASPHITETPQRITCASFHTLYVKSFLMMAHKPLYVTANHSQICFLKSHSRMFVPSVNIYHIYGNDNFQMNNYFRNNSYIKKQQQVNYSIVLTQHPKSPFPKVRQRKGRPNPNIMSKLRRKELAIP